MAEVAVLFILTKKTEELFPESHNLVRGGFRNTLLITW